MNPDQTSLGGSRSKSREYSTEISMDSSSSRTFRHALDHLVILLSAAEFENPPAWLSDNFNIIQGGTHSRGTSRNKLIIFRDGTYIELFSWVPDTDRSDFPAWASEPEGRIIDLALTAIPEGHAESSHQSLMQALKAGDCGLPIEYTELKEGGRKRPDGIELKWATTKPQRKGNESSKERLNVPFFCHDLTPRELRVPHNDVSITTHPCKAIGIARVEVIVPKSDFVAYSQTYTQVFGQANILIKAHDGGKGTPRSQVYRSGCPDEETFLKRIVTFDLLESEVPEGQSQPSVVDGGFQDVFLCASSLDSVTPITLSNDGLGQHFHLQSVEKDAM